MKALTLSCAVCVATVCAVAPQLSAQNSPLDAIRRDLASCAETYNCTDSYTIEASFVTTISSDSGGPADPEQLLIRKSEGQLAIMSGQLTRYVTDYFACSVDKINKVILVEPDSPTFDADPLSHLYSQLDDDHTEVRVVSRPKAHGRTYEVSFGESLPMQRAELTYDPEQRLMTKVILVLRGSDQKIEADVKNVPAPTVAVQLVSDMFLDYSSLKLEPSEAYSDYRILDMRTAGS